MSRPRPICIPCKVEMRCERNDQLVNDPQADNFPSTYWSGDQYRCPACGHAIVTGFGAAMPERFAVDKETSIQFTVRP